MIGVSYFGWAIDKKYFFLALVTYFIVVIDYFFINFVGSFLLFVFLSIDEASFITYDLIMVVSWRYVLAYKKLESVIDIVFYK